jgi:hypothetical protein
MKCWSQSGAMAGIQKNARRCGETLVLLDYDERNPSPQNFPYTIRDNFGVESQSICRTSSRNMARRFLAVANRTSSNLSFRLLPAPKKEPAMQVLDHSAPPTPTPVLAAAAPTPLVKGDSFNLKMTIRDTPRNAAADVWATTESGSLLSINRADIGPILPRAIQAGDRVGLRLLNRRGTVLMISGGDAWILMDDGRRLTFELSAIYRMS